VACPQENTLAAFVEHALPPDQRERVVAHLDGCESCLAVTSALVSAATSPARTAHGETPPPRIGRYDLLELLGRGAMGTVWLARDPRLDRRVALKIVRTDRFVDPAARARLSREARAMARVKHPNVVAVYDTDELDNGVFIAMELVDGVTLDRWLAVRERPWREIMRAFAAAGRGLAAAHAVGIVHRDFKPSNVLVDRDGRVTVSDFGIALVGGTADGGTDAASSDSRDLARTGALAGTPRYMSPEQFRTGAVDARSDQYSFAVALYEALYRSHPFDGDTAEELRASASRGMVRPIPANSAVPRRIYHVLERALRVEPTERFPDMAAVLRTLEVAPRTRAVRAGALAASVIAVTAAAVVLTRGNAAPEPIAPAGRHAVLVAPLANRTGDARLDDTIDVAIGDVLARSLVLDRAAGGGLRALAHQLGADDDGVDIVAAKLAQRDHRSVAAVSGVVARDGDGIAASIVVSQPGALPIALADRAPREQDAIAMAIRLGNRLRGSLGDTGAPVDRVLSASLAAVHAWSASERRAAVGDSDGAIALLHDAIAYDSSFAEAHGALGLLLYDLTDYDGAAAELERALRDGDRMAERDRLALIGDYDGAIGKYAESIAAYEQVLAKWPGDARAEIDVTATALDAQSWPLALELARRAAEHHGNLPVVRANLVIAELAAGRLDDAARDGDAMVRELAQPTPYGTIATALADTLVGRRADARARLDRLDGTDPTLAGFAVIDLAIFEGRLDDAERDLRARISQWPAAQTIDERIALARLLLRRGDRANAYAMARSAAVESRPRLAYLAASTAVEAAGDDTTVEAELARTWAADRNPERRIYGLLLAGDVFRASGRAAQARSAYADASQLGASWVVHDRLARGDAAAGDHAAAVREANWCVDHLGEAALFASPSLALLPEAYLLRARELAAGGAPASDVAAAYSSVVDLAPASQHDPLTDEARTAGRLQSSRGAGDRVPSGARRADR
jgi:tetratricopeptide (TPR) repeat protein